MHTANDVIMPVLGMNQDTGKIVRWLAAEGQLVKKGDPLLEVETDKAVAEIESPASGFLSAVSAHNGDDVPVGKVIAVIAPEQPHAASAAPAAPAEPAAAQKPSSLPTASPLAARMAAEHHLDLAQIRPQGGRVEKGDVLAYLNSRESSGASQARRFLASPKARRLAAERGLDLKGLRGSGPDGAVLAVDLPDSLPIISPTQGAAAADPLDQQLSAAEPSEVEVTPGAIWKIMAEHTAAAWREAPHFFLLREVDASQLLQWRKAVQKEDGPKITVTDLLVKLSAIALRQHPAVNARYQDGKIIRLAEINVGIAAAVEAGLVVPVIHGADRLGAAQIAAARAGLLQKARDNRLRPEDISGGTFTISNLGMYGVDAFLAVLNAPQSAILAVGRIADRVVPVNGQVGIRPMMTVSLSFDHRTVDGARGAQFLDTLARLIEEPLSLLS
jgi:pyruvate dehydrogenase E2 component (dihydrolipoamide acetyltransferase)